MCTCVYIIYNVGPIYCIIITIINMLKYCVYIHHDLTPVRIDRREGHDVSPGPIGRVCRRVTLVQGHSGQSELTTDQPIDTKSATRTITDDHPSLAPEL